MNRSTARLGRSQKVRYQTSIRPSRAGTFSAIGVAAMCSSTARNPASISPSASGPIAISEGQPDGGVHRVAPADPIPETEHVVGVDPERRDLGGVGRHGDEVCATASGPSEAVSHARADRALVSVSCVVNVFDEITNRVVAGSRSPTARSDRCRRHC